MIEYLLWSAVFTLCAELAGVVATYWVFSCVLKWLARAVCNRLYRQYDAQIARPR